MVKGQNDGLKNEDAMILSLNNKTFSELNDNLKDFLRFLTNDQIEASTKISCEKVTGGSELKPDINIIIEGKNYYVSIKKEGGGHSVHEENLEEFILYLKSLGNLTLELEENLKRYIWADGTLDGSGDPHKRIGREFKTKHPEICENISKLFNDPKYKYLLLERFLFLGKNPNLPSAEFIYLGNPSKGLYATKEEVMDLVTDPLNRSRSAAVPLGPLTVQARGKKREKNRGKIQLKWGNLTKNFTDIKKVSNHYFKLD